MIECLKREIQFQKDFLNGSEIETVYFGGGTPSLLSREHLHTLLETIYQNFKVVPNVEITFEVNPEDVNTESLTFWKQEGVNRLSVGIQTFENDRLKYINRSHTGQEAISAIDLIKEIGFDLFSCDLIYAIPPHDPDRWESDLDKVIEVEPPHISLYSLTIEQQTVFGNWHKKGKITELSEEQNAQQYELAVQKLNKAGYQHYEVSNFCLEENVSRHNSSYWLGNHYLGIGPGAHSYNGSSRFYNISNNAKYTESFSMGKLAHEFEHLTDLQKSNEYLMTRLRTWYGIDLDFLESRYGYALQDIHGDTIRHLVDENMATFENRLLKLNSKGFAKADEIILKFFREED